MERSAADTKKEVMSSQALCRVVMSVTHDSQSRSPDTRMSLFDNTVYTVGIA